MAATYDPNNDVGTVRLLINDTDVGNAIFSDAEVTRFLTLNGDDTYLAAATALEVIATNEVLVLKVIATRNLKTDGAKVAEALRKQAKAYRDEVDDDGAFAIAAAAAAWPMF